MGRMVNRVCHLKELYDEQGLAIEEVFSGPTDSLPKHVWSFLKV